MLTASLNDYHQLINDFFGSSSCLASIHSTGIPSVPIHMTTENIGLEVMSMDFFDKLEEAGKRIIDINWIRLLNCRFL